MRTRSTQQEVGDGLTVVPLVVLAGIALGVAEGVYHVFGPRPPVGHPGDSGPDVLAYGALLAVLLGVPALAVACAAWRRRGRGARVAVWSAALLPTVLVYADHVGRWRLWPGLVNGDPEGYALRVALLAGAGAAIGLGMAELASQWWLRRAARRGSAWTGALLVGGAALLLGMRLPAEPGAPSGPSAPHDAPNVLLLTVDTLRQDALGVYGGKATPHMDALARGGVVAQGWSPSPWTRPAMGALFAGVGSVAQGGAPQRAVSRSVSWWPQTLRQAGYVTGAVVTNPHLTRRFGFGRGFATFDHSEELERLEPLGQAVWVRWLTRQLAAAQERGDRVAARARRWLDSRPSGPWLLWVHWIDPHLPYELRGEEGQLRGNEDAAWLQPLEPWLEDGAFARLPEVRAGEAVTSPAARRALHELYLREVRFVDAQVGAVFAAAQSASRDMGRGLVWALTSDHGEEFWEHGGFEHGHQLHGEVLRVPLVFGAPGIPPRQTMGGMKLQDLGPTLLSLAKLAPWPPRWEGPAVPRALGPMVVGRDRSADWAGADDPCGALPLVADGMLYGDPQTRVVLRDGRSWIREGPGGALGEYDICADPQERESRRWQDPLPPALAGPLTLLAELDHWRDALGEPGAPVDVDPQLDARLRTLGYGQ